MNVVPLGVRQTYPDIGEILTKTTGTKECCAVAQIITRHRGPCSPSSLDVGASDAGLANLLAVT